MSPLKNPNCQRETHPGEDVLQGAGEGAAGFVLQDVQLGAAARGSWVGCRRAARGILQDGDDDNKGLKGVGG